MKWPGGKSGEVAKIKDRIPAHTRFIEPFFGGGAVFFYLEPDRAMINDHSQTLMDFYRLVKERDAGLHRHLLDYDDSFQTAYAFAKERAGELMNLLESMFSHPDMPAPAQSQIGEMAEALLRELRVRPSKDVILDADAFLFHTRRMVGDKLKRTKANCEKSEISRADVEDNLITGVLSGYYMYCREVMNDIALGRAPGVSLPFAIANFYFVREYCYGSMFRYNAQGEFNIPYGGISYNKKNFRAKIDAIYHPDVSRLLENTGMDNRDFEEFLLSFPLSGEDFIFLDPPYDSDFSDYEGRQFTKRDHERLSALLGRLPAQWMLVIKNTPFILSLYQGGRHRIEKFENTYTYNVRSRNTREAEHLVITNY